MNTIFHAVLLLVWLVQLCMVTTQLLDLQPILLL